MSRTQARIGILGLSLDLYEHLIPQKVEGYRQFFHQLVDVCGRFGSVAHSAFCTTRDQVENAMLEIHHRSDILVVILLSYSPSLISFPSLCRTNLPIVIWNTQRLREITEDFALDTLVENHGMHGAQDLCNCLTRAGRHFGMATGHWQDETHLADLASWLQAAHATVLSRRIKVGLLGHPFQGMGDFCIDETMMACAWGPTVEQLPLVELGREVVRVSEDAVRRKVLEEREFFDLLPGIRDEDLCRSARLSLALQTVAESHAIDALTVHFGLFGDDPRLATCPFLGINHLIAKGLGYAGEGNVTVAALDALLSQLFGQSNFCEMFTADYKNNRVLFYHMAEGNYAMASPNKKPKLKKIDYGYGRAEFAPSQPYLVPIFAYRPGQSTFVNITTNQDGKLKLVAFSAEVLEWSLYDKLDSPHFVALFDRPLGEFLSVYGQAGGTHHLCRVEGHQLEQIRRMSHLLDMELLLP